MTYEQNVKAILESNFAGCKEEIIDIACKRICMLETKKETIFCNELLPFVARKSYENGKYDSIIEILEIVNSVGSRAEAGDMDAYEVFTEIRHGVLALKGGEQE